MNYTCFKHVLQLLNLAIYQTIFIQLTQFLLVSSFDPSIMTLVDDI